MPEDRTPGAGAAAFPELPAPRAGIARVVRLCAPAPEAKAPAPTEPAGGRFNAVYSIEEIARSAEELADTCLAKAQRLPAKRAASLLEIVSLAYATAWQLRAGKLRYRGVPSLRPARQDPPVRPPIPS